MPLPEQIDRITPSLEPDRPVVMRQDWNHLGFFHWDVPAEELQATVPPQLTIDTYEGKAYVGLVPFTVSGVRPPLVPPIPGLSTFDEINVRTYVHRDGRDPGVWFYSLDASSKLAVDAARLLYKLPYFHSHIVMNVSSDALPRIDYDARRDDAAGAMPANAHLHYGPADALITHAAPGTIEHFLVERYILYSVDSEHHLHRAQVHHQPYPLQRADVAPVDETLIWAAGIKRSDAVPLRHYAREVNVKVYSLDRL